jgi:hypothetical protein
VAGWYRQRRLDYGVIGFRLNKLKLSLASDNGKSINSIHKMKVFILISFLLLTSFCYSQKVFSVKYSNQADVKVFVVKYENQADLKVYKVKYQNETGKNDGNWFFVKYQNLADKKIYFVEYENQADLKIFFVSYKNQAGWKNKDKIHLMY